MTWVAKRLWFCGSLFEGTLSCERGECGLRDASRELSGRDFRGQSVPRR